MKTCTHDPAAVLDYTYDFTTALDDGDTITAHTITAPPGVTASQGSRGPTTVTTWVGPCDPSPYYRDVTCRITTAHGRTDDLTIRLIIRET